ncbi:hypothetical protein ACFLU6_13525 [Acidobacteriota bacterium]
MAFQTYYELLNLTIEANLMDIEKAYTATKEKARNDPNIDMAAVTKAFETLKNPNLKRKYDSDLAEGRVAKYHPEAVPRKEEQERYDFAKKRKKKRVLQNPAVAIPFFLVLLIILGTTVYLRWGHLIFLPTYESGTELVYKHDSQSFGTVLEFQSAHRFEGGVSEAAYKVRLLNGSEIWVQKTELNKICRSK